ncbi:MAG: ABC transporter permease [Acidobacteria bacterium RIFCSPLOWO2_12_FULL_60_22]|nr:MAG: ABC transporter permease [Acidobacteria bacterium RIFCSPLOWO2_12_FULL_60_22]
MRERLRQILIKEFIQSLRNPRMRAMIFVVPIVQLFLFGYAVTTDVKHIALAVYDLDHSVASRELVSRFVQSGYFDLVESVQDNHRVRELLDAGTARAVLQLDRGFQETLQAGRTAPLQLIVDGTISNTAGIVLQYSSKIVSQFSQELLDRHIARLWGTPPPTAKVELETRAWFNAELESRNFFVPGVIAMIVTLMSLMLTSMAVVREKEIGTMEQILVTPIRPVEFILGKTIPFALLSFADVIGITLIGVFWFGVPVRGNLLLLLFATGLFLMTTLGLGLLISTLSQTQQQAMMGAFFLYLPAFLLSGFVFPIANMPIVVQWLTLLNPLRYFLEIIRAIFLKGVGADILWPQMLALALLGTATLSLASQRFRKTLA